MLSEGASFMPRRDARKISLKRRASRRWIVTGGGAGTYRVDLTTRMVQLPGRESQRGRYHAQGCEHEQNQCGVVVSVLYYSGTKVKGLVWEE